LEDPELIEGDLFRMVISVPEFGGQTPTSTNESEKETKKKNGIEL
jgi:hypothetical protein